jgi:flavin reductase (DIM6/NTAB) family NADH-FMN oxidoreductase RutF
MLINPTQNPQQNSHIILQTTTPRPIAWIVTQSQEDIVNIAPYSLFTPLSFEPPRVIVSFRAKEDGAIKDTLRNIRESKKCTICMVTAKNKEIMHQTSEELYYNVSESEKFKIATHSMVEGYPPAIGSSPIAYFCDFDQEIALKEDTTIPLILRIKEIFVDETIITDRDSLRIEFDALGHVVADRYTH